MISHSVKVAPPNVYITSVGSMWFVTLRFNLNSVMSVGLLLCVLFQAIGARNLLKSIAKQREAQQQQLQALITEKRMQLERSAHKTFSIKA